MDAVGRIAVDAGNFVIYTLADELFLFFFGMRSVRTKSENYGNVLGVASCEIELIKYGRDYIEARKRS